MSERRQLAVIAAAGLALGAAVLAVTGVAAAEAVRLAFVIGLQALAGTVLWRYVDPRAGAVMSLGMGLALGFAMSTLTGLAVAVVGWGTWGWAIPAVIAGVLWTARRRRVQSGTSARESLDRPVVVALVGGGLLALGTLGYTLRNYPLSWVGEWSGYHPDTAFFEALATSLARLGPLDSIFIPGGEIRYHWFAYAWAGQVSEAAGAAPFVVMTRVLPLVVAVAGILLTAAWARRLSAVGWVPTVAAALLVIGGHLGVLYGGVLPQDSPSQAMSAVWLLALSIALVTLIERRAAAGTWVLLAVIAVLAFATMGGKVSAGMPAVAGAVLLGIIALARRTPWRREAVIAAIVVLLASVAAFVVIIAGSDGGGGLGLASTIDKSSSQQGLNPLEGSVGVLAGTAMVLLGVAARWAGLGWLVWTREWRWRPETILGVGFAGSSLAAIALLSGFNEIWFAAASSAPLAVLTAVGAGEAGRRITGDVAGSTRRLLVAAVVGALAVNGLVWGLWLTGASGGNVWTPTLRWAGPMAGILLSAVIGALIARWLAPRTGWDAWIAGTVVVLVLATVPGRLLGVGTGQIGVLQPGFRGEWFTVAQEIVSGNDRSYVESWSDDQMKAAAWLRENAEPGDLLATNLTFSPFVAAVTRLPTYVSGIRYQAPYGRPGLTPILLEHDAQVFAFLTEPSAATVAPLCKAGVRWLWVDPRVSPGVELGPWAEPVVTGADAAVLRLDPAACGPA
jgi:hypothetical protein